MGQHFRHQRKMDITKAAILLERIAERDMRETEKFLQSIQTRDQCKVRKYYKAQQLAEMAQQLREEHRDTP